MCRIVGYIDLKNGSDAGILATMRDTLAHGGPDNAGSYLSEKIAIGHRRLSIIDLSPAGNQPVETADYVLVFNGEIYNYKAIQTELRQLGIDFTSDADTEVLLKAYSVWGKDCVHRFRGMFAFAIWHKKTQELVLCRDRVGVKPLYVYHHDGLLMFASELKAFHAHPRFDKSIDLAAVSLFLQQGYITAPNTIFKYVKKLPPGHFWTFNAQLEPPSVETYWSAQTALEAPMLDFSSEEAAIAALEPLLTESFGLRLVADVPVGVFLSGGIDSSLVAALLQKDRQQPLQTFTIGFDNPALDEAPFARAVAQHLGTAHTELYCSEKDFEAILPELADFYDEPFGDSSAIPTYLVSKLAKNHVKVSLSADGGDELFGGYVKYEAAHKVFGRLHALPQPLRQGLRHLVQAVTPEWVDKNAQNWPILRGYKDLGHKFSKLQRSIAAETLADFFNAASTYIAQNDLEKLLPIFKKRFETTLQPQEGRTLAYLGYIDIMTYLESDILTKVDRATMRVALEGREPFLDQNIIDFALRLPDHWKIRDGQTKYLLRQILYKYVPKTLIERPKQGFAVPLGAWLSQPQFKAQLQQMCGDTAFIKTFQLHAPVLDQWVQAFLNPKNSPNTHLIWYLFTLYNWYNRWLRP